eukprot:326119_1
MGSIFSGPEHVSVERKKETPEPVSVSKMGEIQNNYWQLLVETRIAIMEESDRYSLMDDEKIDDTNIESLKDFIYCHQQAATTHIIQSLIDAWLSMNSTLLKEKNHWQGLTQALHKLKDMENTAWKMSYKLCLFQDEQNKVALELDDAQQQRSYKLIRRAVNDINKQLDSYTNEAKSALQAAIVVDGVGNHRSVHLDWKADSYHWIFLCLSSRVMHQEDPKRIFDKKNVEMAFKKANNMNYWLVLLTTRSKMKVLLIRCMIRKRNVIDLLAKDKIPHDAPGVDSLYTLESTISTYTGLEEWATMKSVNDISYVVWLHQKSLSDVQKEMSKNINQIERW